MREIYLVTADALHVTTSTNGEYVVDVNAIIFIAAQSLEEALTLARSALINYGYHLTEIQEISVTTPSAVLKLKAQLRAQYKAALVRGYGFELIALPR
ncbi:hypothetical protein [Nitrosomonas sp. Nm34]|uniref:hypothetical protein n=1 Tax=Nitrosomonas sp. Nm34 TaxID=1881055 RepID=UPI0008EA05C8|nr:hypothetical protein [Nitrosomonas sp. Nm34]SFJ02849.1 hypothetical protein SAMN05428978_108510 [Nitrosomonas sp. Nm34]